MNHHTQDFICPLCAEKLTQANDFFTDWFFKLVKVEFPDAHISWSYRNEQDQNQMVYEGKSKLHWPDSAHNFRDANFQPKSRAVDLFEIDNSYKALFRQAFYEGVNTLNLQNSQPVKWGGSWPTLGDRDHFQLNN